MLQICKMLTLLTGFILTLSVLFRTGQGSIVIVEQGKPASFQVSFPKAVKSVRWEQWPNNDVDGNLTTCSFVENNCTDLSPPRYHGYVITSATSNTAGLNITTVVVYQNTLVCKADTGQRQTIEFKAYVPPKKPVCTPSVNETYVTIKCTTDNVYPTVNTKIYRREAQLTKMDLTNEPLIAMVNGSGSDGDNEVTWTWFIPVYRMRLVNTFYVEMRPMVDTTVINTTVAVSDDIVVSFSVPEVVITRCPVGPRVGGKSILNGTNATCTCEITSRGFPSGYASWYRKDNTSVGFLDDLSGSSTIRVSYNSADPDQTYECRPFTPLIANISVVKYTPEFAGCLATVREGNATNLKCRFSSNVKSVTWQLLGGSAPVNLTTCSFVNNNCSVSSSSIYSGYIPNSDGDMETGLNIRSAKSNETRFTCIADNGIRVDPCALEVSGCPVIVKQGDPTSLQCSFPNDVASVTWQVMSGTTSVNLTTCDLSSNICTDLKPSLYRGYTASSDVSKATGLNILSTRTNETQFVCLASDGGKVNPCPLQVYDWPSTPFCFINPSVAYIEVNCYINYFNQSLKAVIHRREVDLTIADIQPGYPQCAPYTVNGDDANDDIQYIRCTWRIPSHTLLTINIFYVEMSANVSDMSIAQKNPAVSNNVIFLYTAPQVVVNASKCPLGPGVVGTSILIGTSATCMCELKYEVSRAYFAQWYDRNMTVGTKGADGSSTITVSYISSNQDQSFECRPNIPLTENVSVIKYTPAFTSCRQVVEKGHSTNLHCNFSDSVSSVTWQLLDGASFVNLTTCSVVNKKCTPSELPLYSGDIYVDNRETVLNISSAQIDQTKFICLPDVGPRVDPCTLEVYERPEKPYCKQRFSNSLVVYYCLTDKFYPDIDVALYRRELALTPDDIIPGSPIRIPYFNSGKAYPEFFQWRVKMDSMLVTNTFYAVVSAKVSNVTIAKQTAVVSDDLVTPFDLPEVVVHESKCPVGTDVHGQTIKIGTSATCKCEILVEGYPKGHARWYDKNNATVGQENANDGSSTLTVSYDQSDPHPSYVCKPVTILNATVKGVPYYPLFTGSASQTAITGLQSLVVVLVAVCSGICSGFH